MDDPEVLVADSWLVVDGMVLDPLAHVRRFARGVAQHGGDPVTSADMISVWLAHHRGGHWCRMDYVSDGSYRRHKRRVPPIWTSATLWTSPDDPRTDPWTKGPDLLRLGHLREQARERGVDEAVVLDAGRVCEGAHSALVWWRGDVLHHVDDTLPRVSSVTEGWVRRVAAEQGVEVVGVQVTPDEVAGAEVWLLSALHGICPVVRWVDGPELAGPTRFAEWRRLLDRTRVVPTHPPLGTEGYAAALLD